MSEAEKIKKVAVVSGKGGVGKTSIAAAIASILAERGRPLIAVDCDVDAPNLALMFAMQTPDMQDIPVQATEKARFIEANCTHCKACIDDAYCNFDALSWNDERSEPQVDPFACEGCGSCNTLCKAGAFAIDQVESGHIYTARTKEGFLLVYGETIIGASTSGKLVRSVKEHALSNADGARFAIIDGPPGIGCPVIATISDIDYVVVVMEPFPTAFHDASRMIEVIKRFKLPFGIVVNRCNAWPEGKKVIMDFIDSNGYTHLGDIPIDLAIPRSVVNMQSIIMFSPDCIASRSIRVIYRNLMEELGLDE
nr:ATP-binding protein [Candidatus Sigynarchaeum springense]